jgi:hypothetical protein
MTSPWPAITVFGVLTFVLYLCGAGKILKADDPADAKRIEVREDGI